MTYKPKISFAIIVKNESKGLERCLSSIADLVDEIVVVDTGSTDNTKEIAKKFGAKVYDFAWCDDFSKARNEAVDKSTGDWILWIDGDEYFDEENREKLKKLIANLKDENIVYMMTQVNHIRDAPGEEIYFSRPALFRNLPGHRWKYRVHEQILPTIQTLGGGTVYTDIRLMHPGYFEPKVHENKVLRNIRLLHINDLEIPNEPFVVFHLGLMYQSLARFGEAVAYWPRVIELFDYNHSMAAKGFFLWADALFRLGDMNGASEVCVEGLNRFPQDPEMILLLAKIQATVGNLQGAETTLKNLIEAPRLPDEVTRASFNESVYFAQPCTILGEIYSQSGREELGEMHFKKALERNPTFVGALEGLARLYKRQGRQVAFDEVVEKLNSLAAGKSVLERINRQ